MLRLRHIKSLIAVYEEKSFTAAAIRENATQSGISQHVTAIETHLGQVMFERSRSEVIPTAACKRFYKSAVEVMYLLKKAEMDAVANNPEIEGVVNAGLMPVFTRSILPDVIAKCTRHFPDLDIRISESYSRVLTDMVKAQKLDFALVPSFTGEDGLMVEHFASDKEVLVCSSEFGNSHGLTPLEPVRLCDLPALEVVVPSQSNVRFGRLVEYFSTNGAKINRMIELDSMMGTLELIARGNWIAILPRMLCFKDTKDSNRQIHPLTAPELNSDFVAITSSQQPMTPQADFLLKELKNGFLNLYDSEQGQN